MNDRILLLAYPARFRRRHGGELIGTMMEVAGPGGPSRVDLFHLVTGGLRQRFRMPDGRLVALAVVLAALIAGGFGAAAGSWVAARAQDPAPSVASIVGTATPLEAANFDDDVTTADLVVPPGADPAAVVNRLADHLRDAGWQVYPWSYSDGVEARNGDLWLRVYGFTGNKPSVFADVKRVARATYYGAILIGFALGALAGWLTAAAFAYRVVDARRPAAALSAGISVTLLAIPAAALYLALAVLVRVSGPGERARSLFWIWDSALGIFPEPLSRLHWAAIVGGVALGAVSAVLSRRGTGASRAPVSE